MSDSRVSTTVPMSVGLVGSVALRRLPNGIHESLNFRGSLVFGGLRAEVGFGRLGAEAGRPRIVSTSALLVPCEELWEVHLGRALRAVEGESSAWIQLAEADGTPITDHLHIGRVTPRARPFSFRIRPLVRIVASVAGISPAAGERSAMEVTGDVEFVRGISATLRLVSGTVGGSPPVVRVASLEIMPGASGVRFSARFPWVGSREIGVTSIQLLDGAGRPLTSERGEPVGRRILGNAERSPSTLSIH